MKPVIVFVCVILGAWYVQAANIVLVEEQKLHHLHDACQEDPATYADHELLHHLAENIDNPQVGAHMLCESTKVGLQKENGELDLETIKNKVALSVSDSDKVDRLVRECAIKKKSPEKTAIHLFMCLDNNGVTYFHEF
uniref:Odorant-binding protein 11 n=1 Tax=Monochamus alternatus TaxID=192382 RepID=A0A1I9HZL7_MONAT|nr:odorant-binding protein 11 [Monochamus alternatus]